MSKVTGPINGTNNQAQFDYDISKIFIWNNRYEEGTLNNATAGPLDYLPGTLLGRIAATGKLVPCTSGAIDGSGIPVGVLKTSVSQLGAGADQLVNFCIAGDVAAEKLILDGADTLDTDYNGRILRDRINADTMGIKAVEGTELTGFDNQ
jgi:Bacteriophage lambda head decoration protein D